MNALSNQHGAATNRTLSNILAMLGIVMASFALLTNAAQAGVAPDTLIAYWNFNPEPPPGIICGWGCPDEEPFQSDSGSGQIDVTGWGGAVAIGGTHGAGTEINALFGDPAGSAFVCDQCNFPNQCPEEGGCAGFCGGMNPDKGCFCDQDCFEFGDCCENICDQCDFPEQCPEEGGCVGFCGEMNPDEECFCDPDCCEFGDCCPNQFEVCGGCEP